MLRPLCAALLLAGCVGSPYYREPVVRSPQGELVCGVHHCPVVAHRGYTYNGCISPVPPLYFAQQRYPNTQALLFLEKRDPANNITLPITDYICAECELAHARLQKLPWWYRRLAGCPAAMWRELQLECAYAKAKKTGNPDDAGLPEGNGTVSLVK